MTLRTTFHNWRERMRKRAEEMREQARLVLEAKGRRSEVEKDGIFYCQFCGKRNARLGSGMVADDAAYCSKSCGDLLAREMFNRDVIRGGGQVVNIGGSFFDSLGTGFFEKKHCKWCGDRIHLDAHACPMCGGAQERRTRDMSRRSSF